MQRIINLKKEIYFIEQYVNLRNSYTNSLLTSPVNLFETRKWLKRSNIEIRGSVEGDILLGVVILYLERAGEIAIFVRDKGRGIGTKLLKEIEVAAKDKNLANVWAWVLLSNMGAQKMFVKNGYLQEAEVARKYNNNIVQGFIFRKKFNLGKNEEY